MALKAIANSYWRSIQRGARAFSDIPPELQEDVRTLARQDVEKGVLSRERYAELIGGPFPEPEA